MVSLKNFVNLFEISKWPKKVKMKSIPEVEEMFYENCKWKLVDREAISRDITQKGEQSVFHPFKNYLLAYPNESLLLCYNPIFPTQKIRVCLSKSDAEHTLRELLILKNKYYERATFAHISQPREWISFGSEQEVEQEKYKFREEKIMVEWIGPLMSRRENVCFADRDPENLLNGCIYVDHSNLNFDFKLVTQRDASVQACVLKRDAHAQTEIRLINELFECASSRDCEEIVAAREQNEISESSSVILEAESSTGIREQTKEDRSTKVKSFVNIEYRRRLISSVDWHPRKIDHVVVAYKQSKSENDEADNLIDTENNLVPKKLKVMQEHELRIDERLFDGSAARNIRENDFLDAEEDVTDGENETDGEDVDSSLNRGKNKITEGGLHRTNSTYHVKPPLERRTTYVSKEITESEEIHWSSRILELCQQHPNECHKTINSFDVISPPNSSREASPSHSSDSEESAPSQSELVDGVIIQEDASSDESEQIEDCLQITDSDSYTFLWNCDDVLNPKMKLYNTHDINVIRFYPYNDDFVIGGSVKGQIVVWNLQGEWEKITNADYVDDMVEYSKTWEMNDVKIPIQRPIALSERNVSHIVQITSLEWTHPTLSTALGEKHSKFEGKEYSKQQIISSSADGWFKAWNLNSRMDKMQTIWSVELIYTIIARPDKFIHRERHWSIIRALPLFADSLNCISVDDKFYEYDRKDEWGRWHDDTIVSLSRNHHFVNIVLAIGGTIVSLWNIKFKGGPIWWQQYDKEVSLTQGCFTPLHPALFYIGRSDGKVDLWHLGKQMHEPVVQIMASGYSITNLSVVTLEDFRHYQISVSDSKGNFQLLECSYDISWNKNTLKEISQFFKEAVDGQKQFYWWNCLQRNKPPRP